MSSRVARRKESAAASLMNQSPCSSDPADALPGTARFVKEIVKVAGDLVRSKRRRDHDAAVARTLADTELVGGPCAILAQHLELKTPVDVESHLGPASALRTIAPAATTAHTPSSRTNGMKLISHDE